MWIDSAQLTDSTIKKALGASSAIDLSIALNGDAKHILDRLFAYNSEDVRKVPAISLDEKSRRSSQWSRLMDKNQRRKFAKDKAKII